MIGEEGGGNGHPGSARHENYCRERAVKRVTLHSDQKH